MYFLRTNTIFPFLLIYAKLIVYTSSDAYGYQYFLLRIIQHTLRISKSSSIHIADHYSENLTTSLVRMLHANNIRTTVGSSQKSLEKQRGPKNVIFLLQDHCDVLSLVVNSIADLDVNTTAIQNISESSGEVSDHTDLKKLDNTDGGCSEICELLMGISEADLQELQPGSEVPVGLFKWKYALFHHPVWNSANYLIFAALNNGLAGPHPRPFCDLPFIFKFIWRFYRGLKSVICIGEQCFSYNPFEETISEHDPEKHNSDFSWSNMNRKRATISFRTVDGLFDRIFQLKSWGSMVHVCVAETVKRLSGSYDHFTRVGEYQLSDRIEDVLNDVDIVAIEAQLHDSDFGDIEVISTLDSGSVCFIVPEKGHMPSYLLPTRCFSTSLWFLSVGSFALFVIVHEVYRGFCLFAESLGVRGPPSPSARGVSTLMTVYRYIICVSHPRLLLDHITGRLIFTTLSYACLILTTIFLGTLATFLSIRLRFPVPNTIEELKKSDLLFQIKARNAGDILFAEDPKFDWIRYRLSTSFDGYLTVDADFLPMFYYDDENDTISIGSLTGANLSELAIRGMMDAQRAIFRRDGFVVYLPSSAGRKDMFIYEDPSSLHSIVRFDFHIVRECIMSYPFDLRFLSNSVYAPKIKAVMSRLLEAGIVMREYREILGQTWYQQFRNYQEEYDAEPRAFSMVDLQLAFFVLIVGWSLSALVFVAELLRDK